MQEVPSRYAKGEIPAVVFTVEFVVPIRGPGYWVVIEKQILEGGDTWVAVGSPDAPGLVRLDRLELDLDGITIAGDKLYYATRERAQKFIDRWSGKP
jgi:hypothetical protein